MKTLFTLIITVSLMISHLFPITKTNAIEPVETTDTIDLLCKYGFNINDDKLKDLCLPALEKEVTIGAKKMAEKDRNLAITKEEKELLARLVHAEAKGEPYKGKVAVATVVLNRVEHEEFPDTIKEVIYEKNAFEPVQNNSIQQPADKEAYKAVKDALAKQVHDIYTEALYFYNPETATSDWIRTREIVKTIGNHAFAI